MAATPNLVADEQCILQTKGRRSLPAQGRSSLMLEEHAIQWSSFIYGVCVWDTGTRLVYLGCSGHTLGCSDFPIFLSFGQKSGEAEQRESVRSLFILAHERGGYV